MADNPAFHVGPRSDGDAWLQHEVRTSLTVMVLCVQIVARRIEASQTMADEERQALQRHLAAFDQAAHQLVQMLDECRGEHP